MRHWRVSTWVAIGWSILWLVLSVQGGSAAGTNCAAYGVGTDGYNACVAGAGIGFTMLAFIWFIGIVVIGIVWFARRPSKDTVVYGPAGQSVAVSEREAAKRVATGQWSYTAPDGTAKLPIPERQ